MGHSPQISLLNDLINMLMENVSLIGQEFLSVKLSPSAFHMLFQMTQDTSPYQDVMVLILTGYMTGLSKRLTQPLN